LIKSFVFVSCKHMMSCLHTKFSNSG
jgi:hypothetical protein